MSGRPEISVIIATHNRRDQLPRAIASVLAQQDAELELIIVDDASTDDTADYLDTLSDPRISLYGSATNLGPSGARNLGLEAARADIVAFLDSDDAYLPRRLSAPLKALADDPEVVCVLSSARKFDRLIPREAYVPDVTLARAAFEWALICDLIPVEASSMTLRREAALAAGAFCPALRLAEDREFLIRLARRGAGRLLPDVLWEKHWSDDGLSNNWTGAAEGLVAYVRQRPEYRMRYRKLGSYLATKVLVSHVRDRRYGSLWPDFKLLRAAGLIDANPLRLAASHRDVSRYRRTMAKREDLLGFATPPQDWN